MKIKVRICMAALMLALTAKAHAQAPLPPCGQTKSGIYLKVLLVTNCLWKAVSVDGHLVTPGVTQRIENIGKREVVIELYDDYFKGPIARVHDNASGWLNRREVTPQLHQPDFVPPVLLQYPLKPGESVVFKATFQELLVRQPRPNERYTVYMATDIAFRFLDEPVERGFSLRTAELVRSGVNQPDSKFEDIVLR